MGSNPHLLTNNNMNLKNTKHLINDNPDFTRLYLLRVDEVREGRRGVNNGDLRLSLSSSLSLRFSTRRHAASHESVRKGKITIK